MLIFFTALARNTSVTNVEISNISIDTSLAKVFTKALQANKTIKKLLIWKGELGDVGMVALSKGLSKHPKLEELALTQNNIWIDWCKGNCSGSSEKFHA